MDDQQTIGLALIVVPALCLLVAGLLWDAQTTFHTMGMLLICTVISLPFSIGILLLTGEL